MEFVLDISTFAVQIVILMIALILTISLIAGMFRRHDNALGTISITSLDDHYHRMADTLSRAVHGHGIGDKPKRKCAKNVYLIHFDGDLAATQVESLRHQVTAVTKVATPEDEVVILLESNGGIYESYGLGAAQLDRLRRDEIPLTVCIDRVATSGGYMMACLADKVLAAPFALVGSIGVAVSLPNAHRLLEKINVDYLELTAGEHKRTLGMFNEVTEQSRSKAQEELDESHAVFKDHVARYRPDVAIDEVATGEAWLAERARELGLVDSLETSDSYLAERAREARIWQIDYEAPRSLRDRVVSAVADGGDRLLLKWARRLQRHRS